MLNGWLRPGDQIIEINGVDMTCANHLQVNIAYFFPKEPKNIANFGALLYKLPLMCEIIPVIKSLKLTECTNHLHVNIAHFQPKVPKILPIGHFIVDIALNV